jgi:structural maintenance of chromosome 4
MPPKGRTASEEGLLEYLEDIIGTASYKPEIEEAAVEVERLGDERGVVMNRVKLVEKEKGALEVRFHSFFLFFLRPYYTFVLNPPSSPRSPLFPLIPSPPPPHQQDRKKSADAYLLDQVLLVSSQSRLYQRHAHQAGADKALYEEQLGVAQKEYEGEMERQKVDRERYEEGVKGVRETEKGLKVRSRLSISLSPSPFP